MSNAQYFICKHTCTTCISPQTQTILWPTQHGSATRHAVDPGPHRDCNKDCDGFEFLDPERARNPDSVHNATLEELEEHLLTPISNSGQVTLSNKRPFRTLQMLYVADPVQGESNKRRATGDLGFMSATIPLDEWYIVQHLKSYVHGPNQTSTTQKTVKVLIHEWVSTVNTSTHHIN